MAQNLSNRKSSVERKDRELLRAEGELQKFHQDFPDEASCRREAYKRSTGSCEIVCRKCGSKKTRVIDERSFLCLACHKKCWYTADTPFFKFKKVKPWLFAQWLLKKAIKLNGSQLASLLKISKSTGACIMRKVATLTDETLDETVAVQLPAVPCADNFIQLSEYKLVQEHLRVERRKVNLLKVPEILPEQEREQEQEQDIPIDFAQPSAKRLELEMLQSEKESRLLAALTDAPQGFDTLQDKVGFDVSSMLSLLTMLELNGLATRLAGDRYIKTIQPLEKPLEQPQKKSQTKRSRTMKTIESRNPNTPCVPIIVSIMDCVKSAVHDISKLIVNRIFQITGAAPCPNCIKLRACQENVDLLS
jgi:hypothetical protein